MACNPVYRLLLKADGLAPDFARERWLLPHAAACDACRAALSRRGRLAGLLRETLRQEAEAYTPSRVSMIPPAAGVPALPPVRRLLAVGLAAASLAAGAAFLLGRRLEPVTPPRPAVSSIPPPQSQREVSPAQRLHPVPPQEAVSPGAVRPLPRPPRDTGPLTQRPEFPVPDSTYLDGRDPALIGHWLSRGGRSQETARWWSRRLPPVRDDFVTVPLPRFAANGAPAGSVGRAMKEYEEQARVVDTRLFRKVSLQLKGVSLADFCAELEKQTGVRIRAGKGVSDEKVTIFVKERPAREVLRGVARLFGFFWGRSGEAGEYAYALTQDLRSQLNEEELRNRDLNAALLALDEAMEGYRPYLEQTPQQLKGRLARAAGAEKARLQGLVERGGWGGLQIYRQLSPAERFALRNGGEIRFSLDAEEADHRVPEGWIPSLLQSWNVGIHLGATNGREFWNGTTPLSEAPGAKPAVALRVNRSELGQLTLESQLSVSIPANEHEAKSSGVQSTLALGRSPSVASPGNETLNRALKTQAPFSTVTTLEPKPVCPMFPAVLPDLAIQDAPELKPTAVTSAEVWEEVHRRTGMSIIADFYTHLYPASDFAAERAPLFDSLCRAANTLGVRWKKDGDFLLCRSTSFFWDKLKEVPNRHLKRWQEHSRGRDGLPLEDLLEMATLSDQQLDSRPVGEGVVCYWNLREWMLLADRHAMRDWARFAAGLNPEQRRRLFEANGLPYRDLTPQQQADLLALVPPLTFPEFSRFGPQLLDQILLRGLYCPAGWYWWAPRDPNGSMQVRDVMRVGRTREEVLAAARKLDPGAGPDQVRRSEGDLLVHGTIADRIKFGRSRTHGFFNLIGE